MEPDDLLCSRNARPPKDEGGAARCPSCSQNAHDKTVLVRCAQSRATWPLLQRETGRNRSCSFASVAGRGKTRKSPVLAQRAVADSPRWTRARVEPARPSLNSRWREREDIRLTHAVEMDQPDLEKVDCSCSHYARLPWLADAKVYDVGTQCRIKQSHIC
jgi:hypothetical protein